MAGFEYSIYGIFSSATDLGLIAEYHFDDRKDGNLTPFNNDLMVGARVALNDENSTDLLIGLIQDLDSQGSLMTLEASRRFGNNWKLTVEARGFSQLPSSSPLVWLNEEDYLELELFYYF
ncbi:MAG: hypothetical protein V3T17_14470 [Pseudomonadales bacterium]